MQQRRTPASALSALVLTLLHLAAAACLALAYGMTPDGPHDREALDGAGVGALFAVGITVPALALTVLPVAMHWLTRRWFAPPALLLLLAAARYAYLVTAYDPW
ncbi:hypothetical protein [Streptomyces cavernicola]|uniref:Uncharacterized protein n=1 Tax=Streptomyces cavernicola TaxID=3043613 RepID=A0ABT6SEF3_9ACTN|nr:hypothetical protein [Streptomyces sp. B-S-A6]MDI3406314.1 hypothetical protein [Streptomyces sp. B-S-A6]